MQSGTARAVLPIVPSEIDRWYDAYSAMAGAAISPEDEARLDTNAIMKSIGDPE